MALTVEEFRKALRQELDYRAEARNLMTLGRNLADFPRIVVPQPVEDYTTSRVLTMDYIRGRKITALSPVVRLEMDSRGLAEEAFRAYLKQILVDGFFHADPHPGNVFVTDDNRIALLDLGMVARFSPDMQDNLLRLLLAVADGRGDDAADVAIGIGRKRENFDEIGFRRQIADMVGQYQGVNLEQMQIGRVVLEMSRISGDSGIRVPPELTMLGKTLLNLDLVGRTLDPDFDPNAAIRRNAADITRQRLRKSLSPGNALQSLMDTKEFIGRLPGRVNKVLDLLTENRLRLEVDAIDEKLLIEGFQKVANRIAMGLILAAMIMAAAMLVNADTEWALWRWLAIGMFGLALAGALWMALLIFFFDEHRDKRNKNKQ
jgi:predicted unusual protein kinase regulating ubiquinone biosynthesis (AarF/ABC1/UbiB family)